MQYSDSKLTTVHGKILGCIFDKHVISLKYFGSRLLRSLTINTQVHIRLGAPWLGAIANIYLYKYQVPNAKPNFHKKSQINDFLY